MFWQHSQYDSRLGFSFRVLVRVRVSVRLTLILTLTPTLKPTLTLTSYLTLTRRPNHNHNPNHNPIIKHNPASCMVSRNSAPLLYSVLQPVFYKDMQFGYTCLAGRWEIFIPNVTSDLVNQMYVQNEQLARYCTMIDQWS